MRIYEDGQPEDLTRCIVQVPRFMSPARQCTRNRKNGGDMCSEHELRKLQGCKLDVPDDREPAARKE